MARKNYYVVLGVSSEESPAGIRAAFRDRVKHTHPDRVGPEGESAFREIVEAYGVLSDPRRRRAYNGTLASSIPRESPPPRADRWPPAEPLAARSIFAAPESVRPSFDETFDRFLRNFTGWNVPKGERPEALGVEVILSPEEARLGCEVPVGLPVYRTCPVCGGSGRDWLFPCIRCGESGFVGERRTVKLRIRPGIPPGTRIDVPLDALGIRNFVLCVNVSIASGAPT